MSNRTKYALGAAAVAIIMLWILPTWLALALIAVPVVAYVALDGSQKRRLRQGSRKRIGR